MTASGTMPVTACHQAKQWERQTGTRLQVAVNISPSHFLDETLVGLVERVIVTTGVRPRQLELEVTESVVQSDIENLSVFRDLKRLGVFIAIDDFGTAYSSFASLKHLTVDYLKIDRYFIDDMLVDNQSRLPVSSMIEIGHNLGHKVVAEGVEQPEQYRLLRNMGCEFIQGDLFGRPSEPAMIAELLAKGGVIGQG